MIVEYAAYAMLLVSGVSAVIGGIGLLRFPDAYTRSHAATMVSVGGMMLGLLSLILTTFWNILSVKLLVIIIINILVSPTASHITAKVAYLKGVKPKHLVRDEWKGEYKTQKKRDRK